MSEKACTNCKYGKNSTAQEPCRTCQGYLYKAPTPEWEPREADTIVHDSQAPMRTFATGATRNVDTDKYDYEGFLSPLALRSFAAYMHKHRKQADGNLRDSDNWQRGIPKEQYMKSHFRHFMDVWSIHRGHEVKDEKGEVVTLLEALCAEWFNIQGYIHELLKEQES